MDVKLFKPPSLVNLANFDGNTSRRPESQGSITGWTDDRVSILTKFPNKKDNHPSQPLSRKETPAFQGPISDLKTNKPITAGHSYNEMRRKSGLKKIAGRKESSLAAALNAASESSFKRPVVLRKLERENDLKTFPDTFSTVDFELQSGKDGFRLKSRINKRQVLDLKEICGQEHTIEFPTGSFSHQDVKEKTNSSPFHPKLKPRHGSIKNKETNQSWNTNKWSRATRNVSLSSPVHRETTITRDEETAKIMLNSTWSKKPKEEDLPLILYATNDFSGTKTNFNQDKKKASGVVKSVKNTYLHLTRKNFMGISMLVSSQKSGGNHQKGKSLGMQPAMIGLQQNTEGYKGDDTDNIELFRQYLDKITSTNKNTAQGIFKDKVQTTHGITLESKDLSNINFSKSVEKESRISPNALFTKGIREARIKRGESISPKPMSAYDYLLFNSPIKVTTYNKSNKNPKKLTDQLIVTDTDYCLNL